VRSAPKAARARRSTRRLPLTTAASSLAVLVTIVALLTNTNFAVLNPDFPRLEGSELVQVAAAWFLVFVAARSDQILAARAKALADESAREAELIRVVHTTMKTVRDIVGSCLTELQHLRVETEGRVPVEALAVFDESILVATSRLSAIEDLEAVAEREVTLGLGLNVDDARARAASGGGDRDQKIRRLLDEILRLRSERDHARAHPAFVSQIGKGLGASE
jgi:hypothetical protein